MILLIVTIGLLDICLGFGLAMYYGYGPPGLAGIVESLGPMPPAARNAQSPTSGELGAPYNPFPPASPLPSPANLPTDGTAAETSEALAEEAVLGDVRDLASTAQAAAITGGLQSPS